MTVEINANNITNETITKLNRREIASFGLCNVGVYTFTGTPKSRIKGFKTTKNTETEIWFECEEVRFELIKIQPVCEEDNNHYAIRRFLKQTETYDDFWPVLWGCDLFR